MSTFHRKERLKSRKMIGRLFREGRSLMVYPLRAVWLPVEESAWAEYGLPDACAQVAISVPRRNFKTAVARNRLKRRIREAYRLHKSEFYEKLTAADMRVALMLVLVAKSEVPYQEIEAGIYKLIRKFPGD